MKPRIMEMNVNEPGIEGGGVISYYLDCTGISIGGDEQTLRNKKDNDSTYQNE